MLKVGDKLTCKNDGVYNCTSIHVEYEIMGISNNDSVYFIDPNETDVPFVVTTSIEKYERAHIPYIWDVFFKPFETRKNKLKTILDESR